MTHNDLVLILRRGARRTSGKCRPADEQTAPAHDEVQQRQEDEAGVALVGGEGERRLAVAEGESLHTENSHKFTVAGFEALATSSGWRVSRQWTSVAPQFAVFVLKS